MSTELNSIEKIKRNMEVAMEWVDRLDCPIISVSVYKFGVTIMVNEYSVEYSFKLSKKILDIANEKGLSFNVERSSRNNYLYYTCSDIGLDIVLSN